MPCGHKGFIDGTQARPASTVTGRTDQPAIRLSCGNPTFRNITKPTAKATSPPGSRKSPTNPMRFISKHASEVKPMPHNSPMASRYFVTSYELNERICPCCISGQPVPDRRGHRQIPARAHRLVHIEGHHPLSPREAAADSADQENRESASQELIRCSLSASRRSPAVKPLP